MFIVDVVLKALHDFFFFFFFFFLHFVRQAIGWHLAHKYCNLWQRILLWSRRSGKLYTGKFHTGGGGVLTLTWYRYMCLPFGPFFMNFGKAMLDSPQTKVPNLHKLGIFWVNYCKKHPIWAKLGVCYPELLYWWVVNGDKLRYSESNMSRNEIG